MPPAVSPQMVPSLADGVEEEAHLLYPDPIFHLPGSDLALRLWWATPGGSQPCPLSPAPVPLSTSLGLESGAEGWQVPCQEVYFVFKITWTGKFF